jgi:inhibitor of cysteine peptidase
MLKVFRIILMSGLLLTALSACGATNEVKLDAGDDGSQVELKAGQTLVVSLEGNPTTGYTWEAAELDEQVLQQVGETEFKPESGAIGAGGVQTLSFETTNSGQTTLNLVYRRPWEADMEPAETFSVQVVVR